MTRNGWLFLIGGLFVLLILIIYNNLDDKRPEEFPKSEPWKSNIIVPEEQRAEFDIGEQMAKRHCVSCHSYVPPDMIDRISWPRVLGIMKAEMKKRNYSIDLDEWIKVQNFYLQFSPPAFYSTPNKTLPKEQTGFVAKAFANPPNMPINATLLKYLEKDSTLYLGRNNGALLRLQEDQLIENLTIPGIPIDLNRINESLLVLNMGSLKPTEDKSGQLLEIYNNKIQNVIVDSLIRPINFQVTDLKNDDLQSYLISSFGSYSGNVPSGKLSLFQNPNATETIIDSLPGATQSEIFDIDNDGQNEIVALFSQSREAINIYSLNADQFFVKQTSLTFPPVYGTNSFELADMNQDGFVDLILTNGDNDDYSKIYKPYHGLRIYLNDQKNQFEEAYFYHINGASKVKCVDMDNDGDMDFVVLAMYPDLFNRPYETLLYFENHGDLNFEPQYFENQPSANWLLLEIADINQDGHQDIITAANNEISALTPPQLSQTWAKTPIILNVYYNKGE